MCKIIYTNPRCIHISKEKCVLPSSFSSKCQHFVSTPLPLDSQQSTHLCFSGAGPWIGYLDFLFQCLSASCSQPQTHTQTVNQRDNQRIASTFVCQESICVCSPRIPVTMFDLLGTHVNTVANLSLYFQRAQRRYSPLSCGEGCRSPVSSVKYKISNYVWPSSVEGAFIIFSI